MSRKIYEQVLSNDPNNRYALEAMGYLYREDNDPKMAEQYFNKLAAGLSRRLRSLSGAGRSVSPRPSSSTSADANYRKGLQAGAAESRDRRQCGECCHRERNRSSWLAMWVNRAQG